MDKFSELKATAMAATPGRIGDRIDGSGSIKYECTGYDGSLVLRTDHKDMEYGFVGDNADADELFFRLCVPDVVLELLAELEFEKQNNAGVAGMIEDYETKLAEKDKRIAELEAEITNIVDSHAETVAELQAKLATPVRLPDTLAGIGEKLRTQDNRITSEPMFCVYQKREIVADAEYDHDRIAWVDEDGLEANERQRMRLELLNNNCRETPAKWRRVAVKEIDEFVTCCLTEQGCKDYLACNGHNLRLPFIYVKSGFRNAEYIALRNWLMTLTVEGDE